jgi:hypothetical protein
VGLQLDHGFRHFSGEIPVKEPGGLIANPNESSIAPSIGQILAH